MAATKKARQWGTLRERFEARRAEWVTRWPSLDALTKGAVLERLSRIVVALQEARSLTREQRVEQAMRSPLDFARIYLPEFLTEVTPLFHLDIYNLMAGGWRRESPNAQGCVIAAPRGHAKSTICTFIVPLWWIYTKRKRFIVVMSNTDDQAAFFADSIRREIEENDLLRQDFGDIAGDRPGLHRALKWTQRDFLTLHADGFSTRVVARGTGASLRGIRTRAFRPDAVVLDDIEDDENVATEQQRAKVWNWLTKVVLPMLDPKRGEIYAIGTVMHYASALKRLLQSPAYVHRTYKALLPDGSPLWPDRFSIEVLANLKATMGSLAFNQEFMNEPMSEEDRLFRPEWFCWYKRAELQFTDGRWTWRGKPLEIFGGVDLAIEDSPEANFFAYVVIGATEQNELVLVYCWQGKIDFPEQIRELVHLLNSFKFRRLAVEATAYQAALAQQLLVTDARAGQVIKRVKPTKVKFTRWKAMSPLFENARVWFPLADEGQPGEWDELAAHRMSAFCAPLYEQLIHAPKSAEDDLLDALEMAQGVGIRQQSGFKGFF